ncbi:MAG: tRNA lysidine(34) synthetase TilS [Candidatus Methylomirabilales bacterium]
MREQVFAAVRKAITTHGLIQPGEGVVVAVSGGADSIVLLHCLLRLRAGFSLTLHVAHFDHRLRESSRSDALFVQEVAASWGVPATTKSWIREERRGRSLQAEARRARTHFLEDLASQVGATKIAMGHHRDDQAETVLLHLLRGSGLRGLRGMLPIKEGCVIRPMLAVGREDIEAYAKAHQLSFVEDPTNRDLRYHRNRIRWHLLPLLQREYNPSMTRTLARMAALVADDEGYLEEVAREVFCSLVDSQERGACMELSALRRLAPAIRRRILERAIRTVAPEAYVTSAHVEAVERLLRPGGLSAVPLPQNQWAWRSGGLLTVGRRERKERSPIHQELRVPGALVLAEWGMRIEATILPRSMADPSDTTPDRVYIDWKHVLPPLVVRSWRPGDRFRPWRLKGSKKLQDLFVDAKIPREERYKIPVVTDQHGILWVPGFRIDERGAIGGTTAAVLVLAVHRGEGTATL